MMQHQLYTHEGKSVGCHIDTVRAHIYKRAYKQHMLRVPKAWSYDTCMIRQAQEILRDNNIIPERMTLIVEASDTGKIYKISWARFDEKKFLHDRGFGEQFAVVLEEWEVEDTDSRQLSFFN